MLRTDLLQQINSGELWVFVGSGASADAGLPVWADLAERVANSLEGPKKQQYDADRVVRGAVRDADWPLVFRRIEQIAGRDWLEKAFSAQLAGAQHPGRVVPQLADWPVRGFITSNYDDLLERGLADLDRRAWVPVGNINREPQKISREASGVVWHIHGMLGMDSSKSKLIITSEDYERAYLDDGTLERQLGGLIAQRRLLFVGFGFNDPDLLRVLKLVRRHTEPTRPALAIIGIESDRDAASEGALLLERYNVDPIFYQKAGTDHSQLHHMLDLYSHFVARSSLNFGQQRLVVPGPAIASTGLLVYNELALRNDYLVERDLFQTLLESWVLAQLADGPKDSELLIRDLDAIEHLLGEARNRSDPRSLVDRTLASLSNRELLSVDGAQRAALTSKGKTLIEGKAAASEVLHDRFVQSLRARAEALAPEALDAAADIAATAAEFFQRVLTDRALGLALTIKAWDDSARQVNAVQLLQTLPEYMERLATFNQAVVLSDVVRSVLSDPTAIERSYLGAALQAQFAVHLLGVDEATLAERVRQFRQTLFLLDSNVVIPYLARGSRAHSLSEHLIAALAALGCTAATTPLLLEEVIEHANWAVENTNARSALGYREFAALTGRSDYRANAFLEGYLAELADANGPPTLGAYLEDVHVVRAGTVRTSMRHLEPVARDCGIEVLDLRSAFGPNTDVYAIRDELANAIGDKRRAIGTYRHERQVRAEAEILLLVDAVRQGQALVADHPEIRDAYFISTSRVVDRLTDPERPVTMTAVAASQWLATLRPESGDLSVDALVAGLLVELEESGAEFVNRRHLGVAFRPLIDESRSQLEAAVQRHEALTSAAYASDGQMAFSDIDPLDLPTTVNAIVAQAEAVLDEKAARAEKAQTEAKLSQKEREELTRLRDQKQRRKEKYRKRQARHQSSPKRKGKKKRRR